MTEISSTAHMHLNPDLCTGCAWCVDGCENGVLELADGVAVFERPGDCAGCGTCRDTCPSEAITAA